MCWPLHYLLRCTQVRWSPKKKKKKRTLAHKEWQNKSVFLVFWTSPRVDQKLGTTETRVLHKWNNLCDIHTASSTKESDTIGLWNSIAKVHWWKSRRETTLHKTGEKPKCTHNATTYIQGWNAWDLHQMKWAFLHMRCYTFQEGDFLVEEGRNHKIRHTSSPQDMDFNSQPVWRRWDYSLWGGFASENGNLGSSSMSNTLI